MTLYKRKLHVPAGTWSILHTKTLLERDLLWKERVCSKAEQIRAKGGSKFSFTIYPFSEGRQNFFESIASPESIAILIKLMRKALERI